MRIQNLLLASTAVPITVPAFQVGEIGGQAAHHLSGFGRQLSTVSQDIAKTGIKAQDLTGIKAHDLTGIKAQDLTGFKAQAEASIKSLGRLLSESSIAKAVGKPQDFEFLKVSPELAALFGKSHEKFTVPTKEELRIASEALNKRIRKTSRIMEALEYDALWDPSTQYSQENYEQAMEIIKDLKKDIHKDYDLEEEINSISSKVTLH
jgi:hypothetical protein